MEKSFSTNKDADRLILNYLDDKDLFSVCKVNKYSEELCNEEFFKLRLLSRFPKAKKGKNVSYKEEYMYLSEEKERAQKEYKASFKLIKAGKKLNRHQMIKFSNGLQLSKKEIKKIVTDMLEKYEYLLNEDQINKVRKKLKKL